jgi:hypothetical protein
MEPVCLSELIVSGGITTPYFAVCFVAEKKIA